MQACMAQLIAYVFMYITLQDNALSACVHHLSQYCVKVSIEVRVNRSRTTAHRVATACKQANSIYREVDAQAWGTELYRISFAEMQNI